MDLNKIIEEKIQEAVQEAVENAKKGIVQELAPTIGQAVKQAIASAIAGRIRPVPPQPVAPEPSVPTRNARAAQAAPSKAVNTCLVAGCNEPRRSMGYCAKHYQAARSKGWPMPAVENFEPPTSGPQAYHPRATRRDKGTRKKSA